MPKKKTAPKKTTKKASVKKEIFSTQVNFAILTLFCFFIGILFVSLYKY